MFFVCLKSIFPKICGTLKKKKIFFELHKIIAEKCIKLIQSHFNFAMKNIFSILDILEIFRLIFKWNVFFSFFKLFLEW